MEQVFEGGRERERERERGWMEISQLIKPVFTKCNTTQIIK